MSNPLKLPTLNSVVVAGRLVGDPKEIPVKDSNGSAFVLAFNRRSNGNSFATFIPCIVFGDLAKTINEHLKKGSAVLVTGALSQDRSKEKKLQISVAQCQFLDQAPKSEERGGDPAISSDEAPAA